MYEYKVKITRVVDGDTVDAEVDLGFDTFIKDRIRLMGLDTPESRTRNKKEKALGLAAKAYLKELLRKNKGDIILRTSKEGKGKFGRILGTLLIYDGMTSVNQMLIDEGHARDYFGGSKDEQGEWTVEENGTWYRWTQDGYVEIEE
jgi:endonuclease YncB( thermonuclease family)